MKHIVFENAIPIEICNHIREFFDARDDLHVYKENNPNVIKINSPWKHFQDILTPVLSKYMRITRGHGGNVYKHKNLYTTHVDSHDEYQTVNVLIPIYVPGDNVQHFVVFDQWMDNGIGRTWYGDREDIQENGDFDLNKKSASIPYLDPLVHDKTSSDIDPEFYSKYLEYPKHKMEYFKGLTGTAYEFKPGNLLIFNSNNLHCTGKLTNPWKMGMFINFDGSIEELVI
jgi:hypothetical protein